MSPRLALALCATSAAVLGGFWLFRPAPASAPPAPRETTAAAPATPAPHASLGAPVPQPPSDEPAPAPPAPAPSPAPGEPDALPASADADIARIESAVASGQADALPVVAAYLTHSEPAVRSAAREGMLQMGLEEAAPLLREAAGKSKDPREAILLLDAADFLALPSLPTDDGHRSRPAPPPPPRERPARGKSTPLRP